METTHSETQNPTTATAARSFDLDAMGWGPPAKVRRRGKIDKWTRILGVAVVLLLVFNLGVRLGHASRPKAATPPGAGAGAAAGSGAGAGAAGAGAGSPGADGATKPAASGTVKVVDGNSIYVNQPDGTTKRVEANESTRFTRTEPAELRDVQPGDRITVEGNTAPDGSIAATRVQDSASTLQQP
jgi:hypothetical protein